jgi:hypothetical protein
MRQRLLLSLYRLTRYYAWWVLFATLTLAILALLFLQDLKLRSSFQELLPRDDPILEKFERHQETLQETEIITILLKLEAPPPQMGEGVDKLLTAAQRISEALGRSDEVTWVSYRQQVPEPLLPINLLYLSEESLRRLKETIAELQAAVADPAPLAGRTQPLEKIYADISSAIEELISGLGVINPQKLAEALQELSGSLEDLRQLNAEVHETLSKLPQELQMTEERLAELTQLIQSWQSALQPPPPTEEEYLLSKDRRALLVQVGLSQSSRISLEYNQKVTRMVRTKLDSLKLEEEGIGWGLKGPYVFNAESDEELRRDMNKTALITIVGVAILFILVFRRLFYPLLAILPVMIALIFTLVGAKLTFGGLNLLTAFLPAIVLGLGIDYGIQFISHFLEERRGSRRIAPAIRATLLTKGSAMLVAATATSLVLFGLGVIARSPGLAEMGFILGLGVLLSCLLTLLVLPALIVAVHTVLGRRLRSRPPLPWNLSPIARLLVRSRWAVVGLVIAGTIAMAWPAGRVDFAFITEALQPTDLPSQKVRAYIDERFELQQVPDPENYFLFFIDSPQDVRRVSEELARLEAIDNVTSYYSLIPNPDELEEIKRRLATLKSLDPIGPLEQAAIRVEALQGQFGRRDKLQSELARLEEQLKEGESQVLIATGDEELAAEFAQLNASTQAIRQRLEELSPEELEDQLQVLLVSLRAVISQVRKITEAIPSPQEIDDLIANPPPQLRERFFTPEGEMIIYAHVRPEWLWNSLRYDQFIREASEIWDDYLGLPMIRATLEDYMQRDFWWSTALAVLVILVVLRLDFSRSPLRWGTGLSLTALGLGYLWMLGVMDLLGIDFNVANILISPLLIGLGVDNCVYLLHRHRDLSGGSIERALASTAVPILANTLATMIGFGSLMLAETPVLRVLGQSAVMGIGFMTLFSLTFLPAVIALRGR